jgi:hypothetical protein
VILPESLRLNSGVLVEALEIEADIKEGKLSGSITIELHYSDGKSKRVKVSRCKEWKTPEGVE